MPEPRRISIGDAHIGLGADRPGPDGGPAAIRLAGLEEALLAIGHTIAESYDVFPPAAPSDPSARVRHLAPIAAACSALADRVAAALAGGSFPLVLGGDHSVAIGTISGMARHYRERDAHLGLLWIDAHTDMNTPATSPTGNVHGMPLAVLLGHGPEALVGLAGEAPAVAGRNVALIGVRDSDPGEAALIRESGVRIYTMAELDERGTASCVREALDRVSSGTAGFHLSFDLDALDPASAPGVSTAEPGGLTLREARLICEKSYLSNRLCGMDLLELNPLGDPGGATAKAAVRLIQTALGRPILW